jgi:hypothetical protein
MLAQRELENELIKEQVQMWGMASGVNEWIQRKNTEIDPSVKNEKAELWRQVERLHWIIAGCESQKEKY